MVKSKCLSPQLLLREYLPWWDSSSTQHRATRQRGRKRRHTARRRGDGGPVRRSTDAGTASGSAQPRDGSVAIGGG